MLEEEVVADCGICAKPDQVHLRELELLDDFCAVLARRLRVSKLCLTYDSTVARSTSACCSIEMAGWPCGTFPSVPGISAFLFGLQSLGVRVSPHIDRSMETMLKF